MKKTTKRLFSALAAGALLLSMPISSAQAAKTKLLGDVNDDTEVTIADCVLLSRYVAAWDGVTVDPDTADLDRDGVIDTKDAVILARYLAKWEGYDKYIHNIETDPLRIEAQPQAFAVDYGEDAKLSVTVAGGEAPYTYQWSYNGEDISGATKAEYVPEKGGNYRCTVTDSDGAVINSQTAKCSIHPIIKTQPVDGADNFHVEVAGGTNLNYHWEKEVLGEWRVQRESYGAGYGATSVGKYRCVITDFDGYELTSDVVRWYGKGELTVSNIHLSDAADANYGLTIDFTHQKIEHFRYPMLYWIDGVKHRVTMEEAVTGQYPEDASFSSTPVYYDYNVPVCSPYAASGLYGDYLDLYVDATGEGPLYFDWQISPTFEQALAGNFTSIKKESGSLGLGTEHLRFPMKENDDPVHCYGYVRCIVTDRNGESRISEFGNPWGFDHDTFITTPNLLEWAGGGPNNADYIKLGEIRHGGITSEAHFWYRDGAKELALWGCKAPTFKELPEETVSGAELPLNPLADVPTAPIVDTDFSGEVIGTRDAMWNCGYLKLDENGNPTSFAKVYTDTDSYQFGVTRGHKPSEYKCCKYYDWQKLEDADTEIAPEILPRSYYGNEKFEICRRDGTYLPAVELNLYQYNMHEPDCRKPHDMRIWFGEIVSPTYQASKSAGYSAAMLYNMGHTYWWLEFAEPIYAPWYTNNVRYLYAYADHPVTVKNPESYTVIIDDIDLEQAESGDSKNIVKYLKEYSDKYKSLSAEDIAAMLPIKLISGDCNGWCRYYCGGGIDKILGLTGGNAYCVCEYADGTSKYYGTRSENGCTVTLTGMGTYTNSSETTR